MPHTIDTPCMNKFMYMLHVFLLRFPRVTQHAKVEQFIVNFAVVVLYISLVLSILARNFVARIKLKCYANFFA